MSKFKIENVYKELDKLSEQEIVPAYQEIKSFLTKKLLAIQEEHKNKVEDVGEKIDSIK